MITWHNLRNRRKINKIYYNILYNNITIKPHYCIPLLKDNHCLFFDTFY